MKPKSSLRSFLAIAASSLLGISSGSALTYYWDQNGTTASFGTAGGTWDASGSSTWNTDATGGNLGSPTPGILNTATTTSDTINFASSLLSGVIKVSGTVDSGNMTYAAGATNIQLSGGTINLAAATTITVGGAGANSSIATNTITSVISGAGTSLTKAGVGTLVLSGANTYTGSTLVTLGTLQFTNKAALYSGNTGDWIKTKISVTSGATLAVNVGGTGEFSTTDVTTLLTNLGGLGGAVSNNGLRTGSLIGFDTSNASGGSFTIANNLANSTGTGGGAVGVSALGTQTLVLSGANTNTGITRISGGATLVLDYGTNDNSKLSDTANNLNLSGGSLVLRGGSHEEVVTGTTLGINSTIHSGNFISREALSTATINLNAFTLSSTQSTVSFGAENIAKTDRLNVNGILGAWFTVGSHWAINSGSTTVGGATVPGTGAVDSFIRAYSGYTAFASATNTTEDTNFQLLGGASTGGLIKTNTLRIEATANNQTLDLGGNTLQVSTLTGTTALAGTSGGLLYTGGDDENTYTITGTSSARLTPENAPGQALLINVYSGTLNLNVRLSNTSSTLNKTGSGTLVIQNDNTTGFTAATRVYQGALRLENAGATGSTAGGIFIQNGAALELANSVAIDAEALAITGNGVSNAGALRNVASNSSSYAGEISIGSGHARINSDTGGLLTLTGGVINAVNSDVTFGGAGNTTVSTLGIKGTGNLIKDGAGTLTLSATNTYTGSTTVSDGTLALGASGSIATSPSIRVGTNGTFDVSAVSGGWSLGSSKILGGDGAVTGSATFDNDSIFAWNLSVTTPGGTGSATVADTLAVTGNLVDGGATGGSVFKIVLAGGQTFADPFWTAGHSWSNVLTSTGGVSNLSTLFTSFSYENASGAITAPTGSYSFSLSGSTLNYSAVPEPTSALAGLLLTAGLLRRRRSGKF